ncbi:MAG: hypothetical protein AABZ32_02425 [Bacteroidota bacterium]
MHDLESMKFVNEKVKDSNDSYDFSNRRSEDLMYVILNPEEHTPAAIDAAKNELNSRNIPIEKHEEIVSDAILIKEIELASHLQSLSKNERILVCMTPPKLTFIITWYFKQRGYTQKLNEMDRQIVVIELTES